MSLNLSLTLLDVKLVINTNFVMAFSPILSAITGLQNELYFTLSNMGRSYSSHSLNNGKMTGKFIISKNIFDPSFHGICSNPQYYKYQELLKFFDFTFPVCLQN